MNGGLFYAFLAPLGWSFASLVDKYVLAHKVKNTWSYVAVTGLITIIFSGILFVFLDWNAVIAQDAMFACISGGLTGAFIYTWIFLLAEEDTSTIVGYAFIYPAFVALLSFLFLGETISLLGYAGMGLTVLGTILLSLRQSKVNKKTKWWLIICGTVILAFWGFFTKIAVTRMPPLNAYALSSLFEGMILLGAVTHGQARKAFFTEVRIIGWASFSELFNWIGYAAAFVALAAIPATIVTSICAIMPVTVLVFERIIDAFGGNFIKDHLLLPKLIPLLLISIGVALLAVAGF